MQKQNAAIESKTAQQNATISSAIEQQNTTIATEFEKQNARIADKVSSDGKYPELTAGFANNLVGRGEAVDATIGFRASGGMSIEDGAARVKELHGNSVVWNQKARLKQLSSQNGLTITTNADGSLNIEGTVTSAFNYETLVIGETELLYRDGRKYLVNAINNNGIAFGISGYPTYKESFIWSQNSDSDWYGAPSLKLPYNTSVNIKNLRIYIVDLTQMFGAGNEPTTIEEFNARTPLNVDLYAYHNEGEVISTNAEGIKSVGFNAWDEQWEQGMYATGREGKTILAASTTSRIRNANPIEVLPNTTYSLTSGSGPLIILCCDKDNVILSEAGKSSGATFTTPQNCKYVYFYVYNTADNAKYKNDICINLSHSGYRNGEYQPYMQFIRDIDTRIREAFPNGLRSAGNAHDKVYNKNGKGYIEKHIGVVDLGSLNWDYIAPVMGASVPNIFRPTTYAERIDGLLCENYIVDTKIALDDSATNKSIKREGGSVYIKDTAYTNAATFKAAMSGVMLYYELAEPIITEYDEPFNLDYEVWDFGTEQMIASKPSAPIKAKIAYGFNAVDMVRTAQIEIAELKTQIAQMQTMMASLAAQPAMIDIQTGNI